MIPAGSLLAQWQAARDAEEKQQLADAGAEAARPRPRRPTQGQPGRGAAIASSPRSAARCLPRRIASRAVATKRRRKTPRRPRDWGLDPALFGKHPDGDGRSMPRACACRRRRCIEVRLPADLVGGLRVRRDRRARSTTGAEGSVQLQVLTQAAQVGCSRATPSRATALDRAIAVSSRADRRARRQRGAEAHRGGVRRVPPAVPGGAVLHEDRAGRRSRHAHAVLSRRRSPARG